MKLRTAVVITTLNEGDSVGPLVRSLVPVYPVFVIDEESTD
jgi:hypothetical protein